VFTSVVVAVLVFVASLTAEAQPAGKVYRISFLGLTPGEESTSMRPLLERLHELGYSQGKNMTFESLSAEGRPERLPQLGRDVVRARPDVLITGFGTLTAQAATTTIPIVFTLVGDPVGADLVTSLGRRSSSDGVFEGQGARSLTKQRVLSAGGAR
jgi:putative ABC transport system substrate-binding protein